MHRFQLDIDLARSTTNRRDWLRGVGRPFSLHAMMLNPYSQRRLAVARLMPNLQQMTFHGERWGCLAFHCF
jgi:hypothetical protein